MKRALLPIFHFSCPLLPVFNILTWYLGALVGGRETGQITIPDQLTIGSHLVKAEIQTSNNSVLVVI